MVSGITVAINLPMLLSVSRNSILTLATVGSVLLVSPPALLSQRSSAAVLSEHEIEKLDDLTPQQQAELLLERSLDHFRGANEQIAARVDGWRGKITLDARMNHLFMTATNSDDMAVRAAALEVAIATGRTRRGDALASPHVAPLTEPLPAAARSPR